MFDSDWAAHQAGKTSGLPTGASAIADANASLASAATRSPAKANLLEVAKTLDPRFGEDMPQEIADAFANGDVQRIFRTSKYMPSINPDILKPEQGGRVAHEFGDYTGSIYVQHKDGRIARFKNPEVAEAGDDMRHAGWKAKTAGIDERSPFFDQAHVIREDSFSEIGSVERMTFDRVKALNPTLSNDQVIFGLARQGHQIATPTTAEASEIMGKQIFETMKVGSTNVDAHATHRGDMVSDIFESTGERHFFAGDSARGTLSTEPTESFISRRAGLNTPPPTPESLGAPSAAKVQGTVGETKAEEVIAKVTTSAESAPVKMGEAASETVTGVKATVDKGVTIGRTVLKDAGSKAKNFIDTGAKSATKLEGKGGLIGAGVAAAAAVVAFGAHRHHKTQEHQRSSGGPSEASQGQRGGSFEGYMQSSGAHIQMNGAGYDNPEMQTARFKPIDSAISNVGNSFSNIDLSNLSSKSAIMYNYSDSHKAGSTPDRMKSWQFLSNNV